MISPDSSGQETSPDTSGQEKGPWGKPTVVLAAAFVVLVVVLLIVVLATSGGDTGSAAPPGVATTTPPTGPSSPASVEDGPTTTPTAPPADVTWMLYRTVALPVSRTAGPRNVGDSMASGFAHTPTGALMAAAQIPVRKLIAPDWRSVAMLQIAPGPGRDAYIALRQQIGDQAPEPGQLGQIAGFRVVNYTADSATVQIATRFVSGKTQVTTLTLQWQGGDWREVLQPDGSDSPTVQALPSLIGYVEWGGV